VSREGLASGGGDPAFAGLVVLGLALGARRRRS
jgi:MYXO-CTERM domain-containing protein